MMKYIIYHLIFLFISLFHCDNSLIILDDGRIVETSGAAAYLSATDTLVTITEKGNVVVAYPQYTPTTDSIDNMLNFELTSHQINAQSICLVSFTL